MATFLPTTIDADLAREACLTLCDAFAQGRAAEYTDSGRVGEALAHAVKAFPGLEEFADEWYATGEGDLTIDCSEVPADLHPSLVRAVADLAVVGALAELEAGFDWDHVEPAERQCRAALAEAEAAPVTPGLR